MSKCVFFTGHESEFQQCHDLDTLRASRSVVDIPWADSPSVQELADLLLGAAKPLLVDTHPARQDVRIYRLGAEVENVLIHSMESDLRELALAWHDKARSRGGVTDVNPLDDHQRLFQLRWICRRLLNENNHLYCWVELS